MLKFLTVVMTTGVAVLVGAPRANATIVTFDFFGTVTLSGNGSAIPGAPVTGSFSFDDATVDNDSNSQNGAYTPDPLTTSFSAQTGAVIEGPVRVNSIKIFRDNNEINFNFSGGSSISLHGVIPDDTLFFTPAQLNLLTSRVFFSQASYRSEDITFVVSASAEAPEPASVFLLSSGLVLAALRFGGRLRGPHPVVDGATPKR